MFIYPKRIKPKPTTEKKVYSTESLIYSQDIRNLNVKFSTSWPRGQTIMNFYFSGMAEFSYPIILMSKNKYVACVINFKPIHTFKIKEFLDRYFAFCDVDKFEIDSSKHSPYIDKRHLMIIGTPTSVDLKDCSSGHVLMTVENRGARNEDLINNYDIINHYEKFDIHLSYSYLMYMYKQILENEALEANPNVDTKRAGPVFS